MTAAKNKFCNYILECCVIVSGVKLSTRSFVLLLMGQKQWSDIRERCHTLRETEVGEHSLREAGC